MMLQVRMSTGLSRKKAWSCIALGFVIILWIIFMTLISFFSRLQNHHRFTPPGTETVWGPKPTEITCDRSHFRYDLCWIKGPAVLEASSSTLYSIGGGGTSKFEEVKPYPRKLESDIMVQIKSINLKSGPIGPKCQVYHNSPALVFSAGGITGNFYHAFTDALLPLYITLNNLSITDRDVVLVFDSASDWWLQKYDDLIRAFTKHPIIRLHNDKAVHCFTRAYVGLITHGIMALDPQALPTPLTLPHFRSFLTNALSNNNNINQNQVVRGRPKLLWVLRSGKVGRVIRNQDKARLVAQEVGFDVIMFSPTKKHPLRDACKLVSSSHAMIGVHGAGLTHMLFLRRGSVVLQLLPLGLEWVGRVLFGRPARDLGLEYMDYKIGYNESSLSSKYDKESHVLKDAKQMLVEKGWIVEFMDVYLKHQDLMLDLPRFKVYMKQVYQKAKRFKQMHG